MIADDEMLKTYEERAVSFPIHQMLWGRCITIREHLDERNKLIVKGKEALTSREEAYNRMKEGLRRLAALERQF